MVTFRGNVDTRLKKLDDGVVDGTLLALAGLKRLGREAAATAVLEVDAFLPAVGQGAIGIEARAADTRTRDLLARINHAETLMALHAERADGGIGYALKHQPCDSIGRDRRKQYAIAMVAGGVDEPIDRRRTEDRRVVAAARPVPGPHLLDRQLLDRRQRPPRGLQ